MIKFVQFFLLVKLDLYKTIRYETSPYETSSYETSRYKTSRCKTSHCIICYLIVQFTFIIVCLIQTILFFHLFVQSIIDTMDWNNDFDKVWKQIVYETLDDDSDEQIMSHLHAMQQ